MVISISIHRLSLPLDCYTHIMLVDRENANHILWVGIRRHNSQQANTSRTAPLSGSTKRI